MCIGRLLREHPDAAFVVGTFLMLQDAERLAWAQPRWVEAALAYGDAQ